MGNTCASVHIAWRGNLDAALKAISRSYGKLGYERRKKATEGGKHVVLRTNAGQPYVSVYDSENASLDNGELKDLALAASKVMKSAVVFTSLYDSDSYEFIVFANGRQVDLLATDAQSYDGRFKRLSEKSRATKWNSLFARTITPDQLAKAAAEQTVFADSIVAGLSKLIGLTGGQPLISYQDCLDEAETIGAQLYFKKKPTTAAPPPPTGQIRLANGYDPDDTRMLLVYPASWPIAVGKRANAKWMILSEGAGFKGGAAIIRLSGQGGPVLPRDSRTTDSPVAAKSAEFPSCLAPRPAACAPSRGAMRGFKFHNGQIVGDLETRPTDKDHVENYYGFELVPVPSPSSETQVYRAEFPNLDIPPMTAGRTTQILILFVLYDLESQTAGEWEINVSLELGAQGEYSYDLPPIRIAAVDQGWIPVISGLNPRTTYDKSNFSSDPRLEQNYQRELQDKQSRIILDRQLIHPAIASNVTILKDGGQATLDACRIWLEAWLRPLAEQEQGEIRIYTEKKLPAGVFKPSKTRKSLPVTAFLEDKAWGSIFDYEKNYQSVLISFVPKESERAVAGIGLQFSHEKHYFAEYLMAGNTFAAQMAKTLSTMRGRPFGEEAYGSTLHAFEWVTNHPDCFKYLKTSGDDMKQRLDGFAAENATLQAWNGRGTWVPLFDQAGHGKLTNYEDSSALSWFIGVVSGGLHRKMMCSQWCSNVLRMVTPHMWLCRELMDQLNRGALEEVAQVTETNEVFRIVLRSGRALDDLELALLPILPVESSRLSVK